MNNKGFTLAEILIVVAIIAVLVGISIPIFTSQLEKSREAADLANARSAYAEITMAVMTEDTTASSYQQEGYYLMEISLLQEKDGWTTDVSSLMLGGISSTDAVHWLGKPKANGMCRIFYKNNEMYISWGANIPNVKNDTAWTYNSDSYVYQKEKTSWNSAIIDGMIDVTSDDKIVISSLEDDPILSKVLDDNMHYSLGIFVLDPDDKNSSGQYKKVADVPRAISQSGMEISVSSLTSMKNAKIVLQLYKRSGTDQTKTGSAENACKAVRLTDAELNALQKYISIY